MHQPDHPYQQLYDLSFTEIETGLEKTDFIVAYSALSFNDGFLFKTVEPNAKEPFREIVNRIAKPLEELDFNIPFQRATPDANKFLFHLINNESLKLKKWGLHEDDTDFLETTAEYNTEEKFQTLGIYALNKNKLQHRLYTEARQGSIYTKWKIPDGRTEKMIHAFIDAAIPQGDNYRAFEFQKWGNYIMGFFVGFILINLDKGQLSFFAKDDYD
jgi:hypothetical protein